VTVQRDPGSLDRPECRDPTGNAHPSSSIAHSGSADAKTSGVVARFEDAWRRLEAPDIGQFWPAEGVDRIGLLLELVHADLEHRLKANQPVRVEHYLERYAELSSDPAAVVGLLAAEHRERRRSEPGLTLDEYRRRFPALASLLEARIQAQSDSSPPCSWSTIEESPPPAAPAMAFSPTLAGVRSTSDRLGELELLDELGRGGMGIVYKARDVKSGRIVALKTLQGVDAAALYRFKQEFRSLADVIHPNLVTLYELISDGRQWFFTMEYVEGVDFLRHVRGGPRGGLGSQAGVWSDLQVRSRLREALGQLTDALRVLHGSGRLHRDVKPRNVLVAPQGRVVVLDFGLAAELDEAGVHESTERNVLGTIAYMSPEQAAASPLAPSSDWYSVGVMLYEALTGRLPFAGGAAKILRDKQELDPPDPRDAAADVPEELSRLCMGLLRRDPAERLSGTNVLEWLAHERQRAEKLETKGEQTATTASEESPVSTERMPAGSLFVGRTAHLQTLAEAFDAMRQGTTVAVHIHGRSGVGKTALARRFLEELVSRDAAVVLSGRCYEQESVPYKALDGLIDGLSRYLKRLPMGDARALLPRNAMHLSRVFPVLGRVPAIELTSERNDRDEKLDPHESRRRAALALRELLARIGDDRPLVLFLDDLQWGDADSATLLADLVRPPDAPMLLLVISYRSDEADGSPFLKAYLESHGAGVAFASRREIEVQPLFASEARDLALALLEREMGVERRDGDDPIQAADMERAEAIARESGGNPFFVHELAESHRGSHGDADARSRSTSVGVTLDQVLWNRIVRLPEDRRRLIELLAVAGRRIRTTIACRAAGLGDPMESVAALRTVRLIRNQNDEIDTYHDRIRETVLARLNASLRKEWHGRLASQLEKDEHKDLELLAVHQQGAGNISRAAECYFAAASQAESALAFDHAVRLHQTALLLDPSRTEEPETLLPLARALARAGRGRESAQEYRKVASMLPAPESSKLAYQAAMQYLISGHVDDSLGILTGPTMRGLDLNVPATPFRALLTLVSLQARIWLRGTAFKARPADAIPPNELAQIDMYWRLYLGFVMIDPVRSYVFSHRCLLLALAAGESSRIIRAMTAVGSTFLLAGGPGRSYGERLMRIANELCDSAGSTQDAATVMLLKGACAFCQGNWATGLELCDRSQHLFESTDLDIAAEKNASQTLSSWALNFMGSVKSLAIRQSGVLVDAQRRGDLFAMTYHSTFNMAAIRLAEDNPSGASRELAAVMSRWSQSGYHIQHHNALLAFVMIELYRGNSDVALKEVDCTWPRFKRSFIGQIQAIRVQTLHVGAYCAIAVARQATRPEVHLRTAERHAGRLRQEGLNWSRAIASFTDAAIADRRGRADEAEDRLRKSIALFESIDMGLNAAATRRRLGQLVGGEEGRKLVAESETWMTGQGIRNPARMAAAYAPGFAD
jgi:eukaryotic-like serine/threonine-protein kinase